jgi:hypothetical protein
MAGAMSPDLLYFLILDTADRGFSHSWTGLFIFCLPAGIAFSFAFHKFLKYHVILNLPKPLDIILSGLAFQRFKITGLRQWIILSGSVLIGALSHFFWDSFTHAHGEIAEAIPFLLEESTIFGITRQNCTFLQHLSTALGASYVAIYILKFRLLPEPKIKSPVFPPGNKLRFWLWSVAVATLFAAMTVFIKIQYYDWKTDLSGQIVWPCRLGGIFLHYMPVCVVFQARTGAKGLNSGLLSCLINNEKSIIPEFLT